jgi:hypothetical protein
MVLMEQLDLPDLRALMDSASLDLPELRVLQEQLEKRVQQDHKVLQVKVLLAQLVQRVRMVLLDQQVQLALRASRVKVLLDQRVLLV